MTNPLRLGVVRDFKAEGWLSMDLCADQLLSHMPPTVVAEDIAPNFRRVFGRVPLSQRVGFNADRLLNRHIMLSSTVRQAARRNDFIHIVDHSYAHLVNAVPGGRAGVCCHDLDAFRSILDAENERRPWWFRKLANRTLNGLRSAEIVFHISKAVSYELINKGIVKPERSVYAPVGVAAEFTPESFSPVELPIDTRAPFLLHVGSNIPRKRLDILLQVFAVTCAKSPELKLIQVGGPWPTHLDNQITKLGIAPSVLQVRNLSREQLAELYRRAAIVLITSEAEGFGLPVIEALACGAVVIASDIPTLREAGGDVVNYCKVADVNEWSNTVAKLLKDPTLAPSRVSRLAQAARFTWQEYARVIAEAYQRLANTHP